MPEGPRVGVVTSVLMLTAALILSSDVYLFEVELPKHLGGDVIHVPGISWDLGSQAWIFLVPAEEGEAVYALTGNITNVKIYDARRVVVAIPAVEPPKKRSAMWLETPLGRYPVEIRKPEKGVAETFAHSLDEVVNILKQHGHEVKYIGKARLVVETQERQPDPFGEARDAVAREAALPMQISAPTIGATYTVYGGLYFRQIKINSPGTYIIYPIVERGINLCSNVLNATYIGYDAQEMYIGAIIRGTYSNVALKLVVETYQLTGIDIGETGVFCQRTGVLEFNLVNRTRYYIRYVNSTASAVRPMAVAIRVVAQATSPSYSVNIAVSVNASVTYKRTYNRQFEMNQVLAYTSGEGVTVNQYISRIVLGPYFISEGVAYGRHRAYLYLTTRPVSGSCPPLAVDMNVNGLWAAYGQFNPYTFTSTGCSYYVDLSAPIDGWITSWTKTFSGAYYYILRIRYTTTTEIPYVYTIAVMPHESLQGWRWSEVWRSTPESSIDVVWRDPYKASELQVYYSKYPPQQSSTTVVPLAVVHGLFAFNTHDIVNTGPFFTITVAGRQSSPTASSPMKKFEVTLSFDRRIAPPGGILTVYTYYLIPDGSLERIEPPWWIYWARLAKTVVDFIVIFLSVGTIGNPLYTAVSFAVDQALDKAASNTGINRVDEHTITIKWQRGWSDFSPNDKVLLEVLVDPSIYTHAYSTQVVVDRICLEIVCHNPHLAWYIKPTDSLLYAQITQPPLKTWMHGGLARSSSAVFINSYATSR